MTDVVCDENHRYFVKGVRKPGFTEIATDLGVIKPNNFHTDEGRDNGKALHLWFIFLAQGRLAIHLADPRIEGRVEAIARFLVESGFKIYGGEEPLYSPDGDFCTTPDGWGMLGGRRVLIELKGGAKEKWHPLQTAAQKIALCDRFPIQDRYPLYLDEATRSYRLGPPHADEGDLKRWRALANAYHAKSHYQEPA